MSFCNCWDYLLLHEDWGECSEDWAGACRWGGGLEFLTEKKCSAKKCSWGPKTQKKIKNKIKNVGGGRKLSDFFFPTKFIFRGGDFGVFGAPHAPTRGSRGVGKRYTSSYDHDM